MSKDRVCQDKEDFNNDQSELKRLREKEKAQEAKDKAAEKEAEKVAKAKAAEKEAKAGAKYNED